MSIDAQEQLDKCVERAVKARDIIGPLLAGERFKDEVRTNIGTSGIAQEHTVLMTLILATGHDAEKFRETLGSFKV